MGVAKIYEGGPKRSLNGCLLHHDLLLSLSHCLCLSLSVFCTLSTSLSTSLSPSPSLHLLHLSSTFQRICGRSVCCLPVSSSSSSSLQRGDLWQLLLSLIKYQRRYKYSTKRHYICHLNGTRASCSVSQRFRLSANGSAQWQRSARRDLGKLLTDIKHTSAHSIKTAICHNCMCLCVGVSRRANKPGK